MKDLSNRAFIFDMDGTLVDNMRYHTDAWRQMLHENGVDMDPEEFLIRTAGKTNAEIIPTIFYDVTPKRLKELGERKETLYREMFIEHRKPVSGAVEFLERSRELGIRMSVATAAPEENVEYILDGLGLRHFFRAVTTAADVSKGKPDPEIFLASAKSLGVKPHNCIVFEDALNGFEAAYRAGMQAVGITTVNPADEILKLDGVVEAHADFTELEPRGLVERYLTTRAAAG